MFFCEKNSEKSLEYNKYIKTSRNDIRMWRCLSKQTAYSTKHENHKKKIKKKLGLWAAFNQHQERDLIMPFKS